MAQIGSKNWASLNWSTHTFDFTSPYNGEIGIRIDVPYNPNSKTIVVSVDNIRIAPKGALPPTIDPALPGNQLDVTPTPTPSPTPTASPTPAPTPKPTLAPNQLTGIIFGSSESTNALAFDGDITTSYNNNWQNNGFVGIDLGPGITKKLTKVRWRPTFVDGQPWLTARCSGTIQGSNDGTTYFDLLSIPTNCENMWYEQAITGNASYRYFD